MVNTQIKMAEVEPLWEQQKWNILVCTNYRISLLLRPPVDAQSAFKNHGSFYHTINPKKIIPFIWPIQSLKWFSGDKISLWHSLDVISYQFPTCCNFGHYDGLLWKYLLFVNITIIMFICTFWLMYKIALLRQRLFTAK